MLVALLLVSVPVRGLCRVGAAHRLRGCCGGAAGTVPAASHSSTFLWLPLCGSGVAVGPVTLRGGGVAMGLVMSQWDR